jgi:hypothetical protein
MSAEAVEALRDLLSSGADVELLFGDERAPGHSQILSKWSKVLCTALETDSSSSSAARSSSSSSSKITSIPMPGTRKDDWLTAMSFVYPVMPQPEVTWENLEVNTMSRLQAGAAVGGSSSSSCIRSCCAWLRMKLLP